MTRPEKVSDDMLMALADGELPPRDAQQLQRVIDGNPALAARYDDYVRTRRLLQDAYGLEPAPAPLVAQVLRGQGKVVSLPQRRPQALGWGMALAASLVLALGGFWAGRQGAVPASADLATASAGLLTGQETALPDGSTLRVLASYDTETGLCRLIGQDDLRHILCLGGDGGAWVTALSVDSGSAGNFLPASDLATGVIDRMLDDLGAGPALDPVAEAAALGL
jgi:hypothetical protein